jgi:hypothetical protein
MNVSAAFTTIAFNGTNMKAEAEQALDLSGKAIGMTSLRGMVTKKDGDGQEHVAKRPKTMADTLDGFFSGHNENGKKDIDLKEKEMAHKVKILSNER